MVTKKTLSKLYTWIWEAGVKHGFDDVCSRLENEIIDVENCLPLFFGNGKQTSLLRTARNVQIILKKFELDDYVIDKIRWFVKIIAKLLQDSHLYSNRELIIPLLCFHQTSMLLIFSETKVHKNDVLSIKSPYDSQWEIIKNYFDFKDDRYREDVIKISEKGLEVKQAIMDGSSKSPGFEEEFDCYHFKLKIFREVLMEFLPIPQLQEICNENCEEECFSILEASNFLQIIQRSSDFTSEMLHQLIDSLLTDYISSSSPPASMNNSSLVIELDQNVLKSKPFCDPKPKEPSEEVQCTNTTVVTSPLISVVEDGITRSRYKESESATTHCKNVGNETNEITELEGELWKIRNICHKKDGNDSSGNGNQRHHAPKEEVYEIRILKDFESPWEETVPITKLDSEILYVGKVMNMLKWTLSELEKKARSLKRVKDKDIENWLASQKQMEEEVVSEEYEHDAKAFENEKVGLTPFGNAKFNQICHRSSMSFEDKQIRSFETPEKISTLGPLYSEKNPTSDPQDKMKISTGGLLYTEENNSSCLPDAEKNFDGMLLDTQNITTGCPMNSEENAAGGPLNTVDAKKNTTGRPERNIADGLMDTESMDGVGPLNTEGTISGEPLDKDKNITDGQMDMESMDEVCSVDMEEYTAGGLLGSEGNVTGGPTDTEKNAACISLDAIHPLENTTTDLLNSNMENTLQICNASSEDSSEEKCFISCAEMSVPESYCGNEDISLSSTNNDNLDIYFGGDNAQSTSDFVSRRNARRPKNTINFSSDPQIKVNDMNIKSSLMFSSAKGSSINSNSSKSPPILSPQGKVGTYNNRSPHTFSSQDFYEEFPPTLSPQVKIGGLDGGSLIPFSSPAKVGGGKNESSQIFSPPVKIGCRSNDSSSTQVKIGSRNNESSSQQIKMDSEIGRKSAYVRLSPLESSLLEKATGEDSKNSPDKKKNYLSPISTKSSKRIPNISESSRKKSCKKSSSCRKILKAKSRSCSDLLANSSEGGATSPLSSSKGVSTIRKRKLNLHVPLGTEEEEVVFSGKVFAANKNEESSDEEYFTPKFDLSVVQQCKDLEVQQQGKDLEAQECKDLETSGSTTRKPGKAKNKKKPKGKSTTPRQSN